MYRISSISKKTLNNECKDSNRKTILEELQLYIPVITQNNLLFTNGYYKLKDMDIWFSGDNLITRKQIYRRIKKPSQ